MHTLQHTTRSQRRKMLALTMLPLVIVVGYAIMKGKQRVHTSDSTKSMYGTTDVTKPAALAHWPWKTVKQEITHKGVTRYETSSSDGTTAILFDFDFKTNPNLRFEIFDQDKDDDRPYDNQVFYWERGVGEAARQLNATGKKPVIAAWNGLFFGYASREVDNRKVAFHVAPVTLAGKVHYTKTNHRWGFGVKYTPGGPQWKVAHMPDRRWFETLDWGGGSAQCLIKAGQPLRLQPFPKRGEPRIKQPVRSTPQEVGHIPVFDHMKTSRASLAWSQDNRHLYLLFVKENDGEGASALAVKYHQPLLGGWSVPDLQRFWLDFQKQRGTLTAINSDAGGVGQLVYLQSDGKYNLIPPELTTASGKVNRKTYSPDLKNTPDGGAVMFFYVRDAGR